MATNEVWCVGSTALRKHRKAVVRKSPDRLLNIYHPAWAPPPLTQTKQHSQSNGGSWQNDIIATTNSHLPRDTPVTALCWCLDRMNSTFQGIISPFARRFWRTETICFLSKVIYGGFFGSCIWSKNKFSSLYYCKEVPENHQQTRFCAFNNSCHLEQVSSPFL